MTLQRVLQQMIMSAAHGAAMQGRHKSIGGMLQGCCRHRRHCSKGCRHRRHVSRGRRQDTCRIGITALHILEGPAAVDDQVLRPSAEMCEVEGSEEEGFHHKVSVTDSVHGVGAHPTIEAQLLGNKLPVHPKGVPCQCSCRGQ